MSAVDVAALVAFVLVVALEALRVVFLTRPARPIGSDDVHVLAWGNGGRSLAAHVAAAGLLRAGEPPPASPHPLHAALGEAGLAADPRGVLNTAARNPGVRAWGKATRLAAPRSGLARAARLACAPIVVALLFAIVGPGSLGGLETAAFVLSTLLLIETSRWLWAFDRLPAPGVRNGAEQAVADARKESTPRLLGADGRVVPGLGDADVLLAMALYGTGVLSDADPDLARQLGTDGYSPYGTHGPATAYKEADRPIG